MKWERRIEVARTSPEVYLRVRASPKRPSESKASERVRGESEVREDFGVTGRGSDAKGVNGREAERKGERNEEEGGGTGGIGENRSVPLQGPAALQHRYYQGLPDRIKDALLNHSKPGSLARLRSLAQAIDQCHWEREAERTRNTRASDKSAPAKSSSTSTPSSKSSAPSSSKSSSSAPRATATSKDSTHLGANGKLTPEERQQHFDNELCLFCGGAGHKANKCLKSQKKAKARAAVTEPAEDAESTAHISDAESKN
ncbi:hypothetical protein PTI98_005547 [Pleurotus ostreatus]|nr:hypothetical protein PTI98_005547 [Pleurotus ostreatus]